MKKIKNVVYRTKLKTLLLRNSLYRSSHKFDKNIVILSSDKYVNRVKEDINLCYYLMKNGVNSKIISWKNVNNKDDVLVRSVWGYQNELDNFNDFLNNQQSVVLNNSNIIRHNMSKKKQYELFKKYDIPCIDTLFVYSSDFEINEKSVIKPIVSASGNNTYIVDKDEDINKYEDILNHGCMVQPYIDKVNDGELSIILINNEIQYGIKRYPGIFTNECSVSYIDKKDIDLDTLDVINKVKEIDEYKDNVFMRVDILDNKVLELELLDPQLFIETISDESIRNNIYDLLAKEIEKRL